MKIVNQGLLNDRETRIYSQLPQRRLHHAQQLPYLRRIRSGHGDNACARASMGS